eukprot:355792-Chlamydomonas_euryale.AAC.10
MNGHNAPGVIVARKVSSTLAGAIAIMHATKSAGALPAYSPEACSPLLAHPNTPPLFTVR